MGTQIIFANFRKNWTETVGGVVI